MTKTDFVAIAEAIRGARDAGNPNPTPILAPSPQVVAYHRIFDSMARAIAGVCAKQNARFKRDEFLKVCGVGSMLTREQEAKERKEREDEACRKIGLL